MNNAIIWKTTLEKIQLKIPTTDFNTFFHNTKITSIDHTNKPIRINVGTPHPFTTQRLREKFQGPIKEGLEEIMGEAIELCFSVISEETTENNTELGPIFANTLVKNKPNKDTSNLNSHYTFDSFVVGSNNQLASAVALSIAEEPGSYNPFFIHSGVGLGKTHLLHAIGNQIRAMHENIQVLYTPMESFMNDLVDAIRNRTQHQFKKRFRDTDVLLVDDVQSIAGKESTQEELFNTFNSLYMANKQIVFTSDRPPKDIQRIEERLRSRFAAGMIADMQAPDAEVRLAILQAKEKQYQHQLTAEIRNLIADNIVANVRELEGAYKQIVAYERTQHQPITIEDAVKLLQMHSIQNKGNTLVTPQQIMKNVCEIFSITLADLKGNSRKKNFVHPRQIAMYLINDLTDLPLMAIGDVLGGRDHTTIMHGIRSITHKCHEDELLKKQISVIKEKVCV